MEVPTRVIDLRHRAAVLNFPFSSEDRTGELLAVLAASVRPGGRICELGTGLGVGLGWIVAGLQPRTDVLVITIDSDPNRIAAVQETDWPDWVQFITGDATVELPRLGHFDFIFADAEGGKWYGLDITVSALNLGGLLVLDDCEPQDWKSETEKEVHRQKINEVRGHLYEDPELLVTELTNATGVLLAARRGSPVDA